MPETMALTIGEAVATAKVSRSVLYCALKKGELVAKKQGRRTLILREDLARYLDRLPTYQVAA